MTGFFKTIPSELHEAAIIDGANQYEVFFKVMLPLAKAGLLSMGIFNFLGQWNQYILPLVLLTDSKKYVISQGLAFLALEQKYQNDWSGLFAAIVIVMIPTLLVYILFQSQIQKGLTAGALKGWVIVLILVCSRNRNVHAAVLYSGLSENSIDRNDTRALYLQICSWEELSAGTLYYGVRERMVIMVKTDILFIHNI